MSKLATAIKMLKNPYTFVIGLDINGLIKWMPDSMFAKLSYHGLMGEKLNLKDPKTFNEKLQWLKVYDHRPEYTDLVDKLRAKEMVGNIIGKEHIVPCYGSWERAEDIDFDSLPQSFVLKCNHDQGSVVLVYDKSTLNRNETIRYFADKLKHNTYYGTREYQYKNIKPRVFAEEYLVKDIIDYKFYCFNGEPRFLYCGQDMSAGHNGKVDFYDLNWEPMPFYRTDYLRLGKIPRPHKLDKMIGIAKSLSEDIPFVRIDLFEVDEKIYFSEFTLCPASGYMPFVPKEYDRIVGDWLKLPEKKQGTNRL